MSNRTVASSVLLGTLFISGSIVADDGFEAWKKKHNATFQSYLSEEQAAFKKALESEWENFKLAQPKKLFSEPKFDEPPVAPSKPKPQIDLTPKPEPEPQVKPPVAEPKPEPQEKPVPQEEPMLPDMEPLPPIPDLEPLPEPEPPVVEPEPLPQVEPPVVEPEPLPQVEPPVVEPEPLPQVEPPVVEPEPLPQVEPPVVKPEPIPQVEPPVVKPEPVPQVEPPVVEPEQPQLSPAKLMGLETIEVEYLGRVFELPKITPEYLPLKADNKAIADAWETLYPDLEKQAEAIKSDPELAELSDWALLSLMDKYATTVSKNDANGSQLLLWAVLLELGYDSRLAYDDRYLYVLLPSAQKIFGKPSINYGGQDYYILTGRKPTKSLYSYTANQTPERYFDFSFYDKQPTQGLKGEERVLSDDNTGISVSYLTYPQLKDYYRYHPLLDFVWYFRADPKDSNYVEMVNSLKESLKGLPKVTQVETLLSLIQFGFEYQRDDEQWGEEYYSTPMHTLMLQAVDCEDRSFLFAYLVEQVVGIDTVGLKYPGHLAVAVAVDESDIEGKADYVTFKGRKYFVADPTYIGASIGEAMPMFDGVKPLVIAKN